jgi:curved DNA-binding protein CbpA
MTELNAKKNYYEILEAREDDSRRELERQYKRLAARRHPDKGGSEEEMKSLNEAYRVLHNEDTRRQYDAERLARPPAFVPAASPPAQDIGVIGHGLSALLCLFVGLFLLLLVRFQWIWFLWPLAILAVFVILFGVVMARSAMRAMSDALPKSSRIRRHTRLQEVMFWTLVAGGGYGIYLLLTSV